MKKQTLYYIIILIIGILLSGITTSFFLEGRTYSLSDTAAINSSQAAILQKNLEELSYKEPREELKYLQAEQSQLNAYIAILEDEARTVPDYHLRLRYPPEERNSIKASFSYSIDQAYSQLHLLTYSIQRLNYVLERESYINYVQEQAERLNRLPVFTEETKSNIRRTEKELALLQNTELLPVSTIGVTMLLTTPFSNIIGILLAVSCALLLASGIRKGYEHTDYSCGKQYILLFVPAIFLLFLVELLAADRIWQLGDLSVSAQSFPDFKTCRYACSVGTLLLLRILAKCIGCTIVFLFSTALFCMKKGGYLWTGLLLLFSCLEAFLPNNTLWSLRSLFHVEELIGVYRNSYFLKTAVATESLYLAVSLCLLLFCLFFALHKMNQFILVQKELREQQYLDDINQRYSQIRMLKHDLNNHLTAMSLLLHAGKVEEAQSYLQEITSDLNNIMPITRTGINALDMLLWQKSSLANVRNITLQLDWDASLQDIQISDYELCSLFGNMLDNAMEAVLKLPDSQRHIRLKVRKQMDMLCIYCENPYTSLRKENEAFQTTKPDTQNHGLGLRQIRKLAARYQGTVDIHTENQTFCISVLLTTSTVK